MKKSFDKILFFLLIFVFALGNIMVSAEEEREYMVVAYAYEYGTNLDTIDVTKVTHLNYAFSLIYNDEYKQVNPATGRAFGKSGHTPEPPAEERLHSLYLPPNTRGDLAKIDSLREKNPDLKILLSVGGWNARGFADAAATAEAREIFARSCKSMVDRFKLDGIDLDWEFPVIAGWGAIKGGPEDRENFTLLLQAVRDALEPDQLLTIAGSPNLQFTTAWTEFEEIVEILDFINIMTYSMTSDSYFDGALYAAEDWPLERGLEYYADMCVQNYIKSGCPPEKINLGFQLGTFTPASARSSPDLYEIQKKMQATGYSKPGLPLAEGIERLVEAGFTKGWDDGAKNMYVSFTLEDGTEQFVFSYIEPEGITARTDYVKEHGLGGIFFWQWGSDHDNSVVTQLHQELLLP